MDGGHAVRGANAGRGRKITALTKDYRETGFF
jgi:hypothetical protein